VVIAAVLQVTVWHPNEFSFRNEALDGVTPQATSYWGYV